MSHISAPSSLPQPFPFWAHKKNNTICLANWGKGVLDHLRAPWTLPRAELIHSWEEGPQSPVLALPLCPWVPASPVSQQHSMSGPLATLKSHRAMGPRPSWGPPGTHSVLCMQLVTLPPSPPGFISIPTSLTLCSVFTPEKCSILTCHLLPATTCPSVPNSNLSLPAKWTPRSQAAGQDSKVPWLPPT